MTRRKMRPNNPITKDRADKDTKSDKRKQDKEKKTNNKLSKTTQVIPNQQPTINTIKRKRIPPSNKKPVPKQYSSASDSDETDKEQSRPVKKLKPAIRKKQYSSDSDETDNPTKTLKIKRKPLLSKPTTIAKPTSFKSNVVPQAVNYSSDSDSDETDDEKLQGLDSPPKPSQTQIQQQQQLSNVDGQYSSASDSDETDDEKTSLDSHRRPPRSKKPNLSESVQDVETQKNRKVRTTAYIDDSDNPDSGVSEDEKSRPVQFNELSKNTDHLILDRLSFRKKNSYDPEKPVSKNLRMRFNDLFIPHVTGDNFISDSDSDSSDSEDDYDNKEYPPWQQTLSFNRHPENGVWPTPRRFGYSDKLKLEKRIKKICKRENMTFEDARELFSNKKTGQLRFFQKIGKIFPQMPLYRLTKMCKEMYHIKRNNTPWTPEEIKQLEDLLLIVGRNAEAISKQMNRSPKNINDFLYSRNQKTAKASKKWTKEEDEILAKAIAEERKKNPDKISYLSIEPLFKGERSQLQIYGRASHIRHRVQPDGTLIANRKATPQEELEYLQKLMDQVIKHDLTEESQLILKRDRGFVSQSFYLRKRTKIKGFETMHVKDILLKLIKQQKKIIDENQTT